MTNDEIMTRVAEHKTWWVECLPGLLNPAVGLPVDGSLTPGENQIWRSLVAEDWTT